MKDILKFSPLIFGAVLFLSGCKKGECPEGTSNCVDCLINQIKSEPVRNPPAKYLNGK